MVLCKRLDQRGVSVSVVFGLPFPLYVLVAGGLGAAGLDQKASMPSVEFAGIVLIGPLVIVPPLYALQRALTLISTLSIRIITALGPFAIFVLQIGEGRVDYSPATLIGLALFFAGSALAAIGVMRAAHGETVF